MEGVLSERVEDYLKVIYRLTVDEERASTGEIAQTLAVSPASVTDMVQRLAAEDPPLVEYRKHKGVALTEEGEKVALETLRHHRLLELFLHELLGYSWDQVHEEADRLEHVISEYFEERIVAVLGDPERGLHGEPIPSEELHMPAQNEFCLHDLRPGQTGLIRSVRDDDPGLLQYLESNGLVPGAKLEILDYTPYDNNLRLKVVGSGQEIVLGAAVTAQIFVELE
ncbi:MAG: metal-dependent transcriptional regulator [Anaerolineales bacterium]